MANILGLFNDLAATVQATNPIVVRVEGRRRVPALASSGRRTV